MMSDSNFVVEEENPSAGALVHLLSIKANPALAQMTQEELTELVKKLRHTPPPASRQARRKKLKVEEGSSIVFDKGGLAI